MAESNVYPPSLARHRYPWPVLVPSSIRPAAETVKRLPERSVFRGVSHSVRSLPAEAVLLSLETYASGLATCLPKGAVRPSAGAL